MNNFTCMRAARVIALSLLAGLLSIPVFAVTVRVDTVIGNFDIEMQEQSAPLTVANFLNYVRDRDYDNVFFHRSVEGFIVQTGGFFFANDEFGVVPVDPPVVNEFGLSNLRATVAMAKLGSDPDSATDQWFVSLGDNSVNLDAQNGGFTVFGIVAESEMAVADAIGIVPGAVPGVSISIINGQQTSPLSEQSFASALTTLPAIDFNPNIAPFEPIENLVLVNSIRETGADIVAEPSSLDFGVLIVGDVAELPVTITNKGLAALEIASAAIAQAGFSIVSNDCLSPVSLDGSCSIVLSFSPQSSGSIAGSLQINSNDMDLPIFTLPLAGEGVTIPEPRIALSPEQELSIPGVFTGGTGSASVVITNKGISPLTVDAIDISGADASLFTQSTDCASLANRESCTVTVTYTPVVAGASTATLNISSNDPTQPTASLTLTGESIAGPDIELPAAQDFGQVAVNDFSSVEFAVQNVGPEVLEISSISLGGQDATDFILSSACGDEVIAGGSCSFTVAFRPGSEGAKSAEITVTTNDPDELTSILSLTGVGSGTVETRASIQSDTGGIGFGQRTVGTSTTFSIVITNSFGTAPLVISAVDIVRGLGSSLFTPEVFLQENNCTEIAPLTGSCTIDVTLFSETIITTDSNLIGADVLISSNAVNEPELRIGMGGQLVPSPNQDIALLRALDFGDVPLNYSASEKLILSNQGLMPLMIESVALSGASQDGFSLLLECPVVTLVGPNDFPLEMLEVVAPPVELRASGECVVTVSLVTAALGPRSTEFSVVTDDPDEALVVVQVSANGANDSDGVSDAIEDGHPKRNTDGRGDGNGDGIADALQPHVASLPSLPGAYVTLVSPEGTRLVAVRAIDNPLPDETPIGSGTTLFFDHGFFEFVVRDVVGPITVRILFSESLRATNYFKIGPTIGDPSTHWFSFDFGTSLGAEIVGNEIRLHLEDGLTGDLDGVVNGAIVDPGGPARVVTTISNGKSSTGVGCSAVSQAQGWQAAGAWWLMLASFIFLLLLRKIRESL